MTFPISLSVPQIFILSTEWVYEYTLYRFLQGFFDKSTCKNKKLTFSIYIIQYICNMVAYVFFNSPIIFLIINIVSTFLITLNYRGTLATRILATVLNYCLGAIVELLVFGAIIKTNFIQRTTTDINIQGTIIVKILYLLVAIIVSKLHNLSNGDKIPLFYWISLIIIPLINLSIILILSYYQFPDIPFIIIVCVFFIEYVLLFVLLDYIFALQKQSENKLITDFQNQTYRKQLNIMNNALQTTKVMRHDMKNQMLTVQGLLESGNLDLATQHVREMTGNWTLNSNTINTGNIEVDSLINFKLTQAEQNHINVTSIVNIPSKLNLRSFDIATIIGNLFDNAVEALSHVEESNKKIDICIKYDKGRLFINFSNPFTGDISWKNGIPITKKESSNHGVGLLEIRRTAEKYNGQVTINTDKNVFKVIVMLFTVISTSDDNNTM